MNTPDIMFPHLNISIDTLREVFLTISLPNGFSFDIYWYAILITSAIVIGHYVAQREVKRTNQDSELYFDFLLAGMPACIIGARLYYVIFAWDLYKDDLWGIFNTRQGGLAIYGAVLAGIALAYFFSRKRKIDFFQIADTAAPSLILGQAIGRWGNFVNREAFGGYTDSIFALRYLREQVGFAPQTVLDQTVMYNGAEYIQVHPTFLYEFFWNIALFTFMIVYRKHKKFHGEIFCVYLIGYAIGRFFIEGMRVDQLILFNTGLYVSQVLSVILAIIGIIVFVRGRKKQPRF